ncbi:hypothetical protein Lfu02_45330 [Longispora fulva]|uniref:Uncharacterized protein n=1 Tax=Longispora fulva TaxID=619741 RepID=A0A8J7GT58_9ACTN|nr:hypothetical protein [Longispora fulva]MBG6137908.1 hypothetical protein [Longispora fulva]GIG60161.1 hypothetical protein Lfu02_45330 [Longispora fulva]
MRRVLLLSATVLVTLLAGLVNLRLYSPSPLERRSDDVAAEAVSRLEHLRDTLDGGAAEEAQGLFPEGYFFSYELYGLSWVNVGLRSPAHQKRALSEARWALEHVDSDAGRAPFSASLSPAYGAFYVGWSNWLRGGIVKLSGDPSAPERPKLRAETKSLSEALLASPTPFLQSYPGQAWPVDSVVAVASLALAEQVGEGDYAGVVGRWLAASDEHRDPATGLLPHRTYPADGRPVEGARATSQVVALRFLAELDPARARRDWTTFRDLFASTLPGAPGIREFPRGASGGRDVDSGPLVFGLSASASAVGLGTAVLFGDQRTAAELSGLAEATGFRVGDSYLGGLVPIGDTFMVWSLTTTGWVAGGAAVEERPERNWRWPWQLVSVLVVGPLSVLSWRSVRRRRAGGGAGPTPGPSADVAGVPE